MLLAAATAAVDAAFAVVLLTLENYQVLDPFDQLWLAACIAAHVAIYASYTVPPTHRRRLRVFSDYVLYCAMATAPLLRSKPLLGVAVGSMASVGALYYTHSRCCLLTNTQWSPLAEWLYFPLLTLQLVALARPPRRSAPAFV